MLVDTTDAILSYEATYITRIVEMRKEVAQFLPFRTPRKLASGGTVALRIVPVVSSDVESPNVRVGSDLEIECICHICKASGMTWGNVSNVSDTRAFIYSLKLAPGNRDFVGAILTVNQLTTISSQIEHNITVCFLRIVCPHI